MSSGMQVNHSGHRYGRRWIFIAAVLAIVLTGSLFRLFPFDASDVVSAPCGEQGLAGRTDIIFCEGYEQADWQNRWNLSGPNKGFISYERRMDTRKVFHGKASLRIAIPGTTDVLVGRHVQFKSAYDTLYYRWYQMIENGNYFTDRVGIKGNALYGWEEGQPFPKVQKPNGYNIFSLRASARSTKLGIHNYSYTANGNVAYTTDVPVNYIPDEWTCIEIMLRANTVTDGTVNKDGVMRLWVNGNLVDTVTGVVHRYTDILKIQGVDNIDRFISDTNAPGTLVKWEDNLVVAKNRIGCMP